MRQWYSGWDWQCIGAIPLAEREQDRIRNNRPALAGFFYGEAGKKKGEFDTMRFIIDACW